jgi:hypothetical protein
MSLARASLRSLESRRAIAGCWDNHGWPPDGRGDASGRPDPIRKKAGQTYPWTYLKRDRRAGSDSPAVFGQSGEFGQTGVAGEVDRETAYQIAASTCKLGPDASAEDAWGPV